jgi:flavin-dependent dehydrogenase
MTNDYDVIIIGAGPAGMFAADELADSDMRVLVIDAGRDIGPAAWRKHGTSSVMWTRSS